MWYTSASTFYNTISTTLTQQSDSSHQNAFHLSVRQYVRGLLEVQNRLTTIRSCMELLISATSASSSFASESLKKKRLKTLRRLIRVARSAIFAHDLNDLK